MNTGGQTDQRRPVGPRDAIVDEVPRTPKLCSGLAVLPVGDGVVVEGGPERQWFRGRSARRLIPRLVDLLDGTRDLAKLAHAVGEPPTHVQQAVALLHAHGLIESGGPPSATAGDIFESPLGMLLSRGVNTTRANVSGAEALQRLSRSEVAVVGDASIARQLMEDLREAGLGRSRLLESHEPWTKSKDASTFVIAIMAPGADESLFQSVAAACDAQRTPWLPVVPRSSGVEFGPIVGYRYTACYACARAASSDHLESEDSLPVALDAATRSLVAAFVGAETVRVLSRVGVAECERKVVAIDFATWSQTLVFAPRVAGCRNCAPLSSEPPAALMAPYAYEQLIGGVPRHSGVPRIPKLFARPDHPSTRQKKEFPTSPRTPLAAATTSAPPAGLDRGDYPLTPASRTPSLDYHELGTLLARTAGVRSIREGRVQRWAPTGGNLGSVQVYALTNGVKGLTDGVFAYDGLAHELVTIAQKQPPNPVLEHLCQRELDSGWTLLLVITAALRRIQQKYGDFAFRLAHLDAGCATAQLRVGASGHGLRVQMSSRWDDERLASVLGIDLETEPVTALCGLYANDDVKVP